MHAVIQLFKKEGGVAMWIDDDKLDQFNETEIEKGRKSTWDKVYQDLIKSEYDLIKIFSSLPEDLWDKPCGKGNKYSPKIYLQGMIAHYENGHIPQVENLLK